MRRIHRPTVLRTESSPTVLWLPGDGVNGNIQIADRSRYGRKVIANGNAQVSTTSPKFTNGGSYAFDGSGDNLDCAADAGFAFGRKNYRITFWLYPAVTLGSGAGTFPNLIETRDNSGGGNGPVLYVSSGPSQWALFIAGANRIVGGTLPPANAWVYCEISRVSNVTRLFVGGTQIGSDYADTNAHAASRFMFGDNYVGSASLNGRMTDLVVQNGVGGNVAAYTPPSVPFQL